MPSCSVAGCGNHNDKTRGVKYFTFPRTEEYCKKWYMATGKKKIFLRSATICSVHFEATCFEETLQQKCLGYVPKHWRCLKKDAVPTKNVPTLRSEDVLASEESDAIKEWCLLGKRMRDGSKGPEKSKKKKILLKELIAWAPDPSAVSKPGIKNEKFILLSPAGGQMTNSNLDVKKESEQEPSCANSTPQQSVQKVILLPVSKPSEEVPQRILDPKNSTQQVFVLKTQAETSVQVLTSIIGKPKSNSSKSRKAPDKSVEEASLRKSSQTTSIRPTVEYEPPGMTMLKDEFKSLRLTVSRLEDEIRVWQAQYNELNEKYSQLMRQHDSHLRERKKEVDLKVHHILSRIFTPGQIKKLLSYGKTRIRWTPKDMKEALALRNVSPMAYRYLRNNMNYPFPSPSSLRRFKIHLLKRKNQRATSQAPIEVEKPPETDPMTEEGSVQ